MFMFSFSHLHASVIPIKSWLTRTFRITVQAARRKSAIVDISAHPRTSKTSFIHSDHRRQGVLADRTLESTLVGQGRMIDLNYGLTRSSSCLPASEIPSVVFSLSKISRLSREDCAKDQKHEQSTRKKVRKRRKILTKGCRQRAALNARPVSPRPRSVTSSTASVCVFITCSKISSCNPELLTTKWRSVLPLYGLAMQRNAASATSARRECSSIRSAMRMKVSTGNGSCTNGLQSSSSASSRASGASFSNESLSFIVGVDRCFVPLKSVTRTASRAVGSLEGKSRYRDRKADPVDFDMTDRVVAKDYRWDVERTFCNSRIETYLDE
jgi:hypothetical protein